MKPLLRFRDAGATAPSYREYPARNREYSPLRPTISANHRGMAASLLAYAEAKLDGQFAERRQVGKYNAGQWGQIQKRC